MPKLQGVYRAGNGSWYFKATFGRDPLSGKRLQVTRRGFPTATDAARARRELLEEADDGALPMAAGSMTVDELLTLYLDGIDADGRLSPKTRYDYRRNADAYVRPWLGGHQVRALTPEVVLAWQRQLTAGTGTKRGKPLAPNTVRLARASLAGAVRLAVRLGPLRTNPLAAVPRPKPRRSTPSTGRPSRPERSWRPTPEAVFTRCGRFKPEPQAASSMIEFAMPDEHGVEGPGVFLRGVNLDL